MKKKFFSSIVLSMLLSVMLTSCGSSSDVAYDSFTESAKGTATNGSDLYYDEEYGVESEWDDGSDNVSNENVSSNRKLIKTVDLQAETYEFDELVATIEARVATLGGYMENSSIHTKYDNLKYGDFVIRIPVNKLNDFVTEFSEMSNITDKDTSQKDVTLSYVDMQSHKEALLAEESSLLNLLENATSIEDIILLQERLTDVRYQIESMESQLRTMDNLIDYATVNLYISEVETYTPMEVPTMGQRISEGFKDSIDEVVEGCKNLIVFLVVNSPFFVILAILVLIFGLIIRWIVKFSIKKIEKAEEKKQLEKRAKIQASTSQNNAQNGQGNGK